MFVKGYTAGQCQKLTSRLLAEGILGQLLTISKVSQSS
jgi:hypothetical protein